MATQIDSIKTFANSLITAVTGGYNTINPVTNHLFGVILVIMIVVTALTTWIWGEGERVIVDLIRKILLVGFVLFLMNNWLAFTSDIGTGFTQLGLNVGGIAGNPQSFLDNPVNTIEAGWQIVLKMQQSITPLVTGYWWHVISNLPTVLLYEVAMVFTLIGFSILGIQLFIAFIEFLIINMAALIFVPFSIFTPVKFLSDRAFSFVFSGGAKLFVIALIVGVATNFLSTMTVSATPDIGNAAAIAIAALFSAALAIRVPDLGAALVSGSPQLTAGGVAGAGAAAAAAVGGAGYLAARGIGAVSGAAMSKASNAVNQYRQASAPTGGGIAGSGGGGPAGGGKSAGGGSSGSGGGGSRGGGGGGANLAGSPGSRPSWATQTGGLNALNPADGAAAMAAYDKWKEGPGADLPYGPNSYVDYVQRASAAETRGVDTENVEPL